MIIQECMRQRQVVVILANPLNFDGYAFEMNLVAMTVLLSELLLDKRTVDSLLKESGITLSELKDVMSGGKQDLIPELMEDMRIAGIELKHVENDVLIPTVELKPQLVYIDGNI